jgi:hypothetical protein
VLAAS